MSLTPDKKEQPLELDVNKRMLLDSTGDGKKPEKVYRFRAKKMPIVMALDLFARNNDLNIITSPDVTGTVTVDFRDLPFEPAMEAILHTHGYYWKKEQGLIRVYKYETRLFIIDYIKLIREGKSSSQASITSSKGGGGSGEITVTQSDTIDFWKNLEEQLKEIISDEGKLTINLISGTIHVTDFHEKVIQMERFINSITRSIKRQVQIDVKILDVLLNDEFSLGIDWDLVIKKFSNIDIKTSSIVTSPLGGTGNSPTIKLNLGVTGSDFDAIIDALRQQGELKIISKPTIRVINNQPALIKVGTDLPFFEQTTTQGTSGSGNVTTDEVQYITEGLVLSITPQISEDGWIILDVTPIVSRLVREVRSPSGKATGYEMDVKQTTTVVRLKDGEMVTVAGLIQDEDSKATRKIPLLGDVPVLGNAFKGVYTAKNKSELVIFITPTIIKDM